MIDKIGHIKNPLTVIAMFAGIAEVSGAVALPFLKPEVQATYVWFLMLFPFFLVGVFFIVLWRRHHVLYAPSDFQNEQLFADLFRPTTPELAAANAMHQAIAEDEVGARFSVAPQQDEEAAGAEDDPVQRNVEPDEAVPASEPVAVPQRVRGVFASGDSLPARKELKRLESLALSKLSNETGLLFTPDVELKYVPGVVFDGVCLQPNAERVVEMRWFGKRVRSLPSVNFFDGVMKLYSELGSQAKSTFAFIVVLIEEKPDASKYFQKTMKVLAADYPFKVEFVTYSVDELMNYDLIG